jgi:hypothetical protein
MDWKMRKWGVLFLLFCLADVVRANPVIVYDPISAFGYVAVLGSAITVEVSIVTLILLFFDLSVKPVWIGLFIGNLIIYFVLFVPLFHATSSLLVVEGLIVAADGILIKVISFFDTFQQNTFKGLPWKYAFVIAAAGNAVSYYLGTVMQA